MKSTTCKYIVKEAASKRESMDHFDPLTQWNINYAANDAIETYLPEYIENLRPGMHQLDKETNWAAKYPTRAKLFNAGKAIARAGLGAGLLGMAATPVVAVTKPKYIPAALNTAMVGMGSGLLGSMLMGGARPSEITDLHRQLEAAAELKTNEIKNQLMSNPKFKRDFLWNTAFGNLDESAYDYDTVMLDLLAKYKVPKKVDLGVEIPRY